LDLSECLLFIRAFYLLELIIAMLPALATALCYYLSLRRLEKSRLCVALLFNPDSNRGSLEMISEDVQNRQTDHDMDGRGRRRDNVFHSAKIPRISSQFWCPGDSRYGK
jgi:hypothetical protein